MRNRLFWFAVSRIFKFHNSRTKRPRITRILMMRYGFIGDILQTTPVLRVLHEKYPNAKIDFWVSRRASVALANNPRVDTIIAADRFGSLQANDLLSIVKCGFSLRKGNYDVALCLNADPVLGILAWLGNIPFRVGLIDWKQKAAFLDRCIVVQAKDPSPRQHSYLAVVGLLDDKGEIPDSTPVEIYWNRSDERAVDGWLENVQGELIAMFPGGGVNTQYRPWANRKWPAQKWASLGEQILKECPNAKLLFFGTSADERMVIETVQDLPSARVVNLVNKTTFSQLAPLLKRCRLLITNDTAPVFVAAAVGCPTVVIYGPEWPEVAKPLNVEDWYPVWAAAPCRTACTAPNSERIRCENECINEITVETVLATVRNALGQVCRCEKVGTHE